MVENRYCTQCGAMILETDQFCVKCGAPTSAQPATPVYKENKKESLTTIAIFDFIWAILMILFGVLFLASGHDLIQLIKEAGLWEQLNYTEELFLQTVMFSGVISLVSGISSLISGILTFKGTKYNIAFALLIVSSVTGLIYIVGAFGFFVAYLLYKARGCFTD